MQTCSRGLTRFCRFYKLRTSQLRCQHLEDRMTYCTAATIPPAAVEGQPKQYSPKIQKLVGEIGALTLLEVADLNQLLKETLKISDAPMMSFGAMQAVPQKGEEEVAEPVAVKSLFNIKVTKFDESKKVALIKEIKNVVEGLNLVQAKKLVESLPQVIKNDVSKEEAEKIKTAIEAAGGAVELE